MNYKQNYYDYIEYVQTLCRKKLKQNDINYIYYEKHHILPRSIFPEYITLLENTVLLTAREHYLAHYLLTKIFLNKEDNYKMLCAFNILIHTGKNKDKKNVRNSLMYSRLKIKFSIEKSKEMTNRTITDEFRKACSISKLGVNNPSSKRKGNNHWNKGKHFSDETKKLMSMKAKLHKPNNKGFHHTDETKLLLRKASTGKHQSIETIQKRSTSLIGKTLGYKRSEDSKNKSRISALNRKYENKRKFFCVETGEIFQTFSECSRKMNIPRHIKLVLDDKINHCGGYHFKWLKIDLIKDV